MNCRIAKVSNALCHSTANEMQEINKTANLRMIQNSAIGCEWREDKEITINTEFTRMSTWDIFPLLTAIRNVPMNRS